MGKSGKVQRPAGLPVPDPENFRRGKPRADLSGLARKLCKRASSVPSAPQSWVGVSQYVGERQPALVLSGFIHPSLSCIASWGHLGRRRRAVPPSCPSGTEDLPSPTFQELRLEEAERLRGLLSGGHQGATWGRVEYQGDNRLTCSQGWICTPPSPPPLGNSVPCV